MSRYHYLVSGIVFVDGLGQKTISEKVESTSPVNGEQSRLIIADTAICQGVGPSAEAACDWIDGPHIVDLPQDMLMRLVGAPTLPGLE